MATVNLDTASRLDIICRRSDTFNLTIDFNEDLGALYDSTMWKMQVRDTDTSDSAVFTISGDTNFTLDGEELTIEISSSTMDNDGGEYVYDIQTTKDGDVKTWLHGFFTIIEDITE